MPSTPATITQNAANVDISQRCRFTTAIVGSPAAASETIISSITLSDALVVAQGIQLEAQCAFTIGTSGTGWTLRIRQTNVAGSVIVSTGLIAGAAASLVAPSVQGVDTAGVLPGQVYVVTLTIAAGAATSTVSAASLFVTII